MLPGLRDPLGGLYTLKRRHIKWPDGTLAPCSLFEDVSARLGVARIAVPRQRTADDRRDAAHGWESNFERRSALGVVVQQRCCGVIVELCEHGWRFRVAKRRWPKQSAIMASTRDHTVRVYQIPTQKHAVTQS